MDERCDFGMSCRPFLPRSVDADKVELELPLLLGIDITVGMPLSLHEVE